MQLGAFRLGTNKNVKPQFNLIPFLAARLRGAGEQEDVELHGTPWLVGQMVEVQVIVAGQADTAYEKMRQAGRRLPWEELEQQLRKPRK